MKRVIDNKGSAVAEIGDRGHNTHGPTKGGRLLCPFPVGGNWVTVYYNVAWAEVYFHTTKWHLRPSSRLATINIGRKLGGLRRLFEKGSWVPIQHNVAWTKATSRPSVILIHPTVWPHYSNVTDRTGQTDNGLIAYGRTVLQTVAQKHLVTFDVIRYCVVSRELPGLANVEALRRPKDDRNICVALWKFERRDFAPLPDIAEFLVV